MITIRTYQLTYLHQLHTFIVTILNIFNIFYEFYTYDNRIKCNSHTAKLNDKNSDIGYILVL